MPSIIKTRDRAKRLRREPTDAEAKLWSHLRANQLGVKFRRQHPIGPFITDFCCPERHLVIELDGAQHLEQTAYDARRSAYLFSRGQRVLRFWDDAVLTSIDAVLEQIKTTLQENSF
jgi:very-short-patch-repair endonuclease